MATARYASRNASIEPSVLNEVTDFALSKTRNANIRLKDGYFYFQLPANRRAETGKLTTINMGVRDVVTYNDHDVDVEDLCNSYFYTAKLTIINIHLNELIFV
jgi:hypothetical protein